MLDVVVKDGRIVDGTGNPWYKGDVAISDMKIISIGNVVHDAEIVIDAKDLIVAPGFIDTHSHSDLMLIAEPEAHQKIMQGITTEIIGQDGLGEAPIREENIENWRAYLSGLNGDPDIEWNWRGFAEYLDELEESKPSINVASLVGHGNLRLFTMGMENRLPTKKELDEMKRLLEQSMEAGAFGMSTGLIYPPCAYSDTSELVELCKVVSNRRGVFVVHMRDEGDHLIESIEEIIVISKKSGAPIHISHFKASGERNWGKVEEALMRIVQARSMNLDITIDQYPYVAGSTFLSSLLPIWVHEGGVDRMLKRLRDETVREKIIEDMVREGRGLDWGWRNILVTSVKSEVNKRHEGSTIEDIAQEIKQTPFEVIFNLILEEKNAVTMVSFSMSEDDIRRVICSPFQMVCTDGIILGKPHPRLYGSFPRFLGRYVRQYGILRWEEAIRKMTSLPAQRFGLLDRGIIRPGMYADLTIFNPDKIIDKGTFQNPHQFPEGVEYVIVNGKVTILDSEHLGVCAGQVLKHKN